MGNKRALLVGVNRVRDPGVPVLRGCINDVLGMADLLCRDYGFSERDIVLLRDDQATKQTFLRALGDMLAATGPGDTLVFHQSSHGSQVPDADGDEADAMDELLVMHDHDWNGPMLTDDELARVLAVLPHGAQLVALFDSCHSGTMMDSRAINAMPPGAVPRHAPAPAYVWQRRPAAPPRSLGGGYGPPRSVRPRGMRNGVPGVALSAASDDETAADAEFGGTPYGAFSYNLLGALRDGPDQASWDLLHQEVTRRLRAGGFRQTPRLQIPTWLQNQPILGGRQRRAFGQVPAAASPGYGPPPGSDPRYGNDPRYGQPQGPDPRYGQPAGNDPRYGQPPAPDPRYAPPPGADPRYGQPAGNDPRYAQPASNDPRYGQAPGSGQRPVGAREASGRKIALLVGIDTFDIRNGPAAPPLRGCVADARAMALYLSTYHGYTCSILENERAKGHLIEIALEDMLDMARPGDQLLFFVSSYGFLANLRGQYEEAMLPQDGYDGGLTAIGLRDKLKALLKPEIELLCIFDLCSPTQLGDPSRGVSNVEFAARTFPLMSLPQGPYTRVSFVDQLPCSVYTACSGEETAYESSYTSDYNGQRSHQGNFTQSLLLTLMMSEPSTSWEWMHVRVQNFLKDHPPRQSPQLKMSRNEMSKPAFGPRVEPAQGRGVRGGFDGAVSTLGNAVSTLDSASKLFEAGKSALSALDKILSAMGIDTASILGSATSAGPAPAGQPGPKPPPAQPPAGPPQPAAGAFGRSAYGPPPASGSFGGPVSGPFSGRGAKFARDAGPSRRALLVGISQFADPKIPLLPGCINDANLAAIALASRGFTAKDLLVLCNEAATKQNVLAAVDAVLTDLRPGDQVLLYVSSHGSVIPDQNGDEPDGADEVLVVYDHDFNGTMLTDDELSAHIGRLPQGVDLVCIFDTCHSGTLLDEQSGAYRGLSPSRSKFLPPPPQLAARVARGMRSRSVRSRGLSGKLPAVCYAACTDSESALAGVVQDMPMSYFTAALCGALLSNTNQTWEDVHRQVQRDMSGVPQTPQLRFPTGAQGRPIFSGGQGRALSRGGRASLMGTAGQVLSADGAFFEWVDALLDAVQGGGSLRPEPSSGGPGGVMQGPGGGTTPGGHGSDSMATPDRAVLPARARGKFARRDAGPSRMALLVGVDRFADPSIPPLNSCNNDLVLMGSLLIKQFGWSADNLLILNDQAATRDNVLMVLDALLSTAKPGDQVLFFVSSYGTVIPDQNSDEADQQDEVLVMHDHGINGAMLTDDDLSRVLAHTPQGVELTCVFDACHSGTLMDEQSDAYRSVARSHGSGGGTMGKFLPLPPAQAARVVRGLRSRGARGRRGLSGKLPGVCYAACADGEQAQTISIEGTQVGAHTASMCLALSDARVKTWEELVPVAQQLLRQKNIPQTPQLRAPGWMQNKPVLGGKVGGRSLGRSARETLQAEMDPPANNPSFLQTLETLSGALDMGSSIVSGIQTVVGGLGQAQGTGPLSSQGPSPTSGNSPFVEGPGRHNPGFSDDSMRDLQNRGAAAARRDLAASPPAPLAAAANPIDTALAAFKPEDYTVRLCGAMFKVVPFAGEVLAYRTVDEALDTLYPQASPAIVQRTRQIAQSDAMQGALRTVDLIDKADAGIAVYSGIKGAFNLLFGDKSQALETDKQQGVDAAIKLLAIGYLIAKMYPGSIQERVQTFYTTPAAKHLIVYYALVEVALPFLDNALTASGSFISSLLAKYGGEASQRLSTTIGGADTAEAQGVIQTMMSWIEGALTSVLPYAQTAAEQARHHLPNALTVADKVASVVATGADALPVYRYLGARLAAESSVLLASREGLAGPCGCGAAAAQAEPAQGAAGQRPTRQSQCTCTCKCKRLGWSSWALGAWGLRAPKSGPPNLVHVHVHVHWLCVSCRRPRL